MQANLSPEAVCVTVDTREQREWDLSPLRTERGTLGVGDYAIKGLEHVAAIERKGSLDEWATMCGTDRQRFERQLIRLRGLPHHLVVVETTLPHLESGAWRSRITPASVLGSTLGWMASGTHILLAGDRERAQAVASRWLFIIARRYWRTARNFAQEIEANAPATAATLTNH